MVDGPIVKLEDKKILLTGGSGFLGSFVVERLLTEGIKKENIIIPRSSKTDLRVMNNALKVTESIDVVIHLAANVGGIGYNQKFPGSLFYDNAIMGINIIEAARVNKVQKTVIVGTVCAYPKFIPVPFKEETLWDGYPEETNAPYGLAKKMLLVQTQAYRKQYDMNAIYLLPVNLYGPRDNFHPEYSHVIPALIRKIVEAQRNNDDEVVVWGSGSASREFFYVADAARGIVEATMKYDDPDPVNLGTNNEVTIRELVETLKTICGFKGSIKWDTTKPEGQPRRALDVSRAMERFGFEASTSLWDGLKTTIQWYRDNRENTISG
jgi:GDP-L-fucose synthase